MRRSGAVVASFHGQLAVNAAVDTPCETEAGTIVEHFDHMSAQHYVGRAAVTLLVKAAAGSALLLARRRRTLALAGSFIVVGEVRRIHWLIS